MAISIEHLDLGTITLDRSFLVRGRTRGTCQTVPVYAFLIRGAGDPVVVDTGMRNCGVIERIGMRAEISESQALEAQLRRFDVSFSDVGLVLQTHLHVDHSGGLRFFPPRTPIVVNRSELAFAESGTQGLFYASEDLADLRARASTGVRFLDLERTGPVEIAPDIVCEFAGGHTPGMMFVRVRTDGGVATICSDVVYDVQDQLVRPMRTPPGEPEISNNTTWPLEAERAAIQRALAGTALLFPSHCSAARVSGGRVIAVLDRLPSGAAPGGPPG
jgi:glyoxylase-like metal-dependent hydrolase (beta-lactamase superfamily II)